VFLAAFGSDVLAVGVTDTGEIAGEGFVLGKNDIYPKVKPTAIPVIDHLVDLRRQSARRRRRPRSVGPRSTRRTVQRAYSQDTLRTSNGCLRSVRHKSVALRRWPFARALWTFQYACQSFISDGKLWGDPPD